MSLPAILVPEDLTAFATIDAEKARLMVEDATALAVRVAPCIADAEFTEVPAARAILRAAILRWHEAGTGALASQTVGPFGQTLDTRTQRKGMFWPSEIEQLQELCQGAESSGAFAIDTGASGVAAIHSDICALWFGAVYCSCGAVLTNLFPLYER